MCESGAVSVSGEGGGGPGDGDGRRAWRGHCGNERRDQ